MKKIIVEYLKTYKEKKLTQQIENLIKNETFENVDNVLPDKVDKVAIVTSYVAAHAGGMTSILRIGTALCNENFDVTYISLSS